MTEITYPDFSLMEENFLFLQKRKNKMTKIVIAEQTHKWVERCGELQKENTQLKELLRECKYELRGCYTDIGWEDQSLINKIDQALGE